MKIFTSHSLRETQDFAYDWVASLEVKEKRSENNEGALVVGLYGNLGAGKTALVQAIAKELGVEEFVTSPTFVIEKIYETTHPHFIRLIHIDAYRLEKASELQNLNFESLVENSHNLIFIEWPENVKEILPEDHVKIYCDFVDENTRKFQFEK